MKSIDSLINLLFILSEYTGPKQIMSGIYISILVFKMYDSEYELSVINNALGIKFSPCTI
ncbi:MAG: hypothetical protein H5T96_08390 [Tissierellales bacterium]|nr:hypothetical protein [Tissierellales bacterium]